MVPRSDITPISICPTFGAGLVTYNQEEPHGPHMVFCGETVPSAAGAGQILCATAYSCALGVCALQFIRRSTFTAPAGTVCAFACALSSADANASGDVAARPDGADAADAGAAASDSV